MTAAHFESVIHSHVTAAPIQSGARGIGTVAGRIIDAVRKLVQDGLDETAKVAVKQAALRVYDSINVPQIPDTIETLIKTAFRGTIDNLLDTVLGLPLTN